MANLVPQMALKGDEISDPYVPLIHKKNCATNQVNNREKECHQDGKKIKVKTSFIFLLFLLVATHSAKSITRILMP